MSHMKTSSFDIHIFYKVYLYLTLFISSFHIKDYVSNKKKMASSQFVTILTQQFWYVIAIATISNRFIQTAFNCPQRTSMDNL